MSEIIEGNNKYLTVKKENDRYNIFWKENNKMIGYAYQEVDGDFVFVTDGFGSWSGYVLSAIAEVLESLNKKDTGEGKEDECMTKEILLKVFKKVSLLDLSECEFEFGDGLSEDKDGWKTIEDGLWINAMTDGAVVDAIKWDGNIFWMMNNDGSMSPLNPMMSAFIEAGIVPQPVSPANNIKVVFWDCWEIDKLIPEEARWMATINGLVGVVAPTKEKAFEEAMISLRVLIAHNSEYNPPANREGEKEAVDGLEMCIDLFSIFMPKEVAIDNRKEMAMYECFHRLKAIAQSSPDKGVREDELWDEITETCEDISPYAALDFIKKSCIIKRKT